VTQRAYSVKKGIKIESTMQSSRGGETSIVLRIRTFRGYRRKNSARSWQLRLSKLWTEEKKD
jgi:hypothetical protein